MGACAGCCGHPMLKAAQGQRFVDHDDGRCHEVGRRVGIDPGAELNGVAWRREVDCSLHPVQPRCGARHEAAVDQAEQPQGRIVKEMNELVLYLHQSRYLGRCQIAGVAIVADEAVEADSAGVDVYRPDPFKQGVVPQLDVAAVLADKHRVVQRVVDERHPWSVDHQADIVGRYTALDGDRVFQRDRQRTDLPVRGDAEPGISGAVYDRAVQQQTTVQPGVRPLAGDDTEGAADDDAARYRDRPGAVEVVEQNADAIGTGRRDRVSGIGHRRIVADQAAGIVVDAVEGASNRVVRHPHLGGAADRSSEPDAIVASTADRRICSDDQTAVADRVDGNADRSAGNVVSRRRHTTADSDACSPSGDVRKRDASGLRGNPV